MKITKKCVLALASFVLLMLQAFGVKFDAPVVNEILSSAASLLVMLGIITDSGGGDAVGKDKNERKDESADGSEETEKRDGDNEKKE